MKNIKLATKNIKSQKHALKEKAKNIVYFPQKTEKDDRDTIFKQIIDKIFSELKKDLSVQNERTRFKNRLIRHRLKTCLKKFIDSKHKEKI